MNNLAHTDRKKTLALGGIILTIVLLALFFSAHNPRPSAGALAENRNGVTVDSVVTTTLRRQDFRRTWQTYGTVSPFPEATWGLTRTYQCRVVDVMVTPGQSVQKGDPLIQIEPGPDARLTLEQADAGVASLRKQLAMVRQRVQLKLATQQDLVTMEASVHSAEQKLDSLRKQGIATDSIIRATEDGIVASIGSSRGDLVPSGGVLLQVLRQNRMVIVFGVEIDECALLKVGQTVQIHMVENAPTRSTTGKIKTISHAVDPTTRLVMITAVPDHPDMLYLNAFVEVTFGVNHPSVFVVPASAVLPTRNGYELYTLVNHHAVRHNVQVVMKNTASAEITGDGLLEGDKVVILGNYELHDGMTVKEGSNP